MSLKTEAITFVEVTNIHEAARKFNVDVKPIKAWRPKKLTLSTFVRKKRQRKQRLEGGESKIMD